MVIDVGGVQKVANPDDKRSQFLTLADKGVERFRVLRASDIETLAAMREGISDEELVQLLLIGAKMAGIWRGGVMTMQVDDLLWRIWKQSSPILNLG